MSKRTGDIHLPNESGTTDLYVGRSPRKQKRGFPVRGKGESPPHAFEITDDKMVHRGRVRATKRTAVRRSARGIR